MALWRLSLSIVGLPYRKDAILRLAFAYEQKTPWLREWPTTISAPEAPSQPAPSMPYES